MKIQTRREWVEIYHPEKLNVKSTGGVSVCPTSFDLVERGFKCPHSIIAEQRGKGVNTAQEADKICRECWDGPLPNHVKIGKIVEISCIVTNEDQISYFYKKFDAEDEDYKKILEIFQRRVNKYGV